MLTPQRRALLAGLKVADLVLVAAAFIAAVAVGVRDEEHWTDVLEIRVSVRNVLFLLAYLAWWHGTLRAFGLYRSYRLSPSSREWRDLAGAILVALVPLWGAVDVLGFDYVTPRFLVVFSALALAGLGMARRLFRVLARSMRRHGRNLRNAVIVGAGDRAFDMASRLARHAELGYRVVELIDTGETPDGAWHREVLDRIGVLVESEPVDEVFVAAPLDTAQPLIRDIVALCEERGITVRLLSSVVDLMLARVSIDEIDGRPVITIFTGPPDSLHLLAKRAIDVALSTLALVVLSPVLAAVALAVKLDSPGPVLFVHDRVGLNGRRFRFYKFRTMVVDADRQQAALEERNEARGPVFKIRDDPRVTRVGRLIRRLSLDELPQFFNVLRGDMSLVGPRPLPVRDVLRIDVRAHKRRFSVKPGITCLWQIDGREPEFEAWIRTDMEYIDNWSLGLDVKIMLKTIPAVLSGRGAY